MEGEGKNPGQWWQVSATVKGTGDGGQLGLEAVRRENRRWMPERKNGPGKSVGLGKALTWEVKGEECGRGQQALRGAWECGSGCL